LTGYALSPQGWAKKGLEVRRDGVTRSAFELLRNSGISVGRLKGVLGGLEGLGEAVLERVEIEGAFGFSLGRLTVGLGDGADMDVRRPV
jgi:tRNA uridine 5-carboxymethylaminomethyl modification enzyme